MRWSGESEIWNVRITHSLYWVRNRQIFAIGCLWLPSNPRSSLRKRKNVGYACCVFCSLWGAPVAQPVNLCDAISTALYCLCVQQRNINWKKRKYVYIYDILEHVSYFLILRYVSWNSEDNSYMMQWLCHCGHELRWRRTAWTHYDCQLFCLFFITVHYGSVILKSAP